MTSSLPFGLRRDLPRWQHLVTPAWLAAVLSGRAVAAAPSTHWVLLEVGCGGEAAYREAHIPGARYLDTGALEAPPLWTKVDDTALIAALLRVGIRHDSTVIVYGRSSLAAARAAHLMLYAGVHDVRLLDGGFASWQGECEAGVRTAAPARDFGGARQAHLLCGIDVARGMPQLVSVRTWHEYTGQTSGYAYIAARGEIPGALWGRSGIEGDVNSMSEYQQADGTMQPAAAIAAMWASEAIVPGRPTAFYCGTGWRASLAFFYAWLMGWDEISVFDGGWLEYAESGLSRVVMGTQLRHLPRPAGL